jgi:hypothetical protein
MTDNNYNAYYLNNSACLLLLLLLSLEGRIYLVMGVVCMSMIGLIGKCFRLVLIDLIVYFSRDSWEDDASEEE